MTDDTIEYLEQRIESPTRSFAPGTKVPSQVLDDALVAANAAYECALKAYSYLGVCQTATNMAFSHAREVDELVAKVHTLLEPYTKETL